MQDQFCLILSQKYLLSFFCLNFPQFIELIPFSTDFKRNIFFHFTITKHSNLIEAQNEYFNILYFN